MRYWIDCEFLEGGGLEPIHLLSLAMVAEDGRELYLVDKDCPVEKANPFVRQYVLPKVDLAKGVDRREMRRRVLEFVGRDVPEFWGAWASYDWVVLCGLIGRMIDLPPHWPKFVRDCKQWSADLGDPPWPRDEREDAHDALADAKWTRDVWYALRRFADSRTSATA